MSSDSVSSKPEGIVTLGVEEPKPLPNAYLEGKQLLLVFIGFLVSMLLITIDQTIVATALPRIVSDFNALGSVTWVVTAYYLTEGGCMLIAGQILMLSRKKFAFLACIALFELGSLICAVSPSMPVLIFGRAIAGCGAAGIQTSTSSLIPEVAPLEKRPILFASFGIIMTIATVAGPLIGGAFTDNVTWRWCFWINLPCGAVATLLIFFFLKNNPPSLKLPGRKLILFNIDWIGAALVISCFTTFLLAVQWGGNTKPWSNPSVIALLVVSGVLLGLFLVWEHYKGERAMLPLKIIANRTSLGCAISGFMAHFALYVAMYYLPIWYQAKGSTAIRSGIDILPFLLAVIIAGGVAGGVATKTGNYWWIVFLGPLVTVIGSGLLYTLSIYSSSARLVGYQILYGVGLGLVFQIVIVAVQAEYADDEILIPQATSYVMFAQILGGVVSISMGGSIFANELRHYISIYAPDLSTTMRTAVTESVTAVQSLSPTMRNQVITAYAKALDPVFILGIPAVVLASASGLLIRNHNLLTRGKAAKQVTTA